PGWRRSCFPRRTAARSCTSTRASSPADLARSGTGMPYTPILATLGYVLSPDGRQVLLVHRNRRPHDAHFGKYNGLGGKLDAGEDVVAGLRREVREEAGIECDAISLRGTISWPGFGKHGEDWFGFIFRIDRWHGEVRSENAEGVV